jgi:hypothetical protein
MARSRSSKTLIPVNTGMTGLELEKERLRQTLARYAKQDMDKKDFVFFMNDIKRAITIIAQANNIKTT